MATNGLSPLSPEPLEQLRFLIGKESPKCAPAKLLPLPKSMATRPEEGWVFPSGERVLTEDLSPLYPVSVSK